MVTRSQALAAKRKAEPDSPQSASKSSKSLSSDDATTSRGRSTAKPKSQRRLQHNAAKSPEDAAVDDPKGFQSTSAAVQPNVKQDSSVKTGITNIAENDSQVAMADKARTDPGRRQTDLNELNYERYPAQNKEEDRLVARQLMQRLQQAVEQWRIWSPRCDDQPEEEMRKHIDNMAQLCQIATEFGQASHYGSHLNILPRAWWESITDLEVLLAERQQKSQMLQQAAEEHKRCDDAYGQAVLERGASYLGVGHDQDADEAKGMLRHNVLEARRIRRKASEAWYRANIDFEDVKYDVQSLIRSIMLSTDEILTRKEYLRPWDRFEGMSIATGAGLPERSSAYTIDPRDVARDPAFDPYAAERIRSSLQDSQRSQNPYGRSLKVYERLENMEPETEGGQARSASPEEQEEQTAARNILQRIQITVATWRLSATKQMPKEEVDRYLAKMLRLGDLGLQDYVYDNRFLGMLPFAWWDDMVKLGRFIEQRQAETQELQRATAELKRCEEAHEKAAKGRGASSIGLGDKSEDARRLHREAVSDARHAWHEAWEAWDKLERKVREHSNEALVMVDHAMASAERILGHKGYPSPSAAPRSNASSNEDGNSTPKHTKYSERRQQNTAQDQTQARIFNPVEQAHTGSEGGAVRVIRRDPRRAPRGPGAAPRRPGAARNPLDELRDQTPRQLGEARAAYEIALKNFHAVRNAYDKDLAEFIEDQRHGAAGGTRTNFDHAYYLSRGRANHKLAAAWNDLEFEAEQAERLGEFTEIERRFLTRDVRVAEDEGIDVHAWQILHDLRKEETEEWLDRLPKNIADDDEAKWPSMQPKVTQEGRSVGSALNPDEREERIATGHKRKAIDEWMGEQERMRKELSFGTLPSMPYGNLPKEALEGFNGL